MKKVTIPLLLFFLIASPAMSQFATSKYRYARNDVQFAKQTIDFATPQIELSPGTALLGVAFGGLLSKLSASDYDGFKNRFAIYLGASVMYALSEKLFAISGLELWLHGTRFDEYDDGINFTSLAIPIMIGYMVYTNLIIMAGLQPLFVLSSKSTDGDNLNDLFNSFSLGLRFGATYFIMENLAVNLFYVLGLTDYADSGREVEAEKGRSFGFGAVFYPWRKVVR